MVPEHLRFGGGAADSTILPLMAVLLVIAIVLILILPRGKAIVPFLLTFFIIPTSQVVVLGGVHFTILRILAVVGLAKMAFSTSGGGRFPGGFNGIDRAVVLWSVLTLIMFCFTFPQTQALILGLGIFLENLGGYLVVRFLISDRAAIQRVVKALAVLCVIQGVPMIIEQITSINVFGYFAGVSIASAIREGKVRAAGTMGALTAGPVGGLLIPLFLWLWIEKKSRKVAIIGIAGALAMVITSNSSTSWMALIASLLGLAFWPLRKQMRLVRQALVATLVGLHLVMKAPVWALISRVDFTGSSSSYQRYALVDMTMRHFRDWWIMGTPEYVNWGWDTWDLCNQFVAVALTGGLLTLIVFIMIFSRSFGAVGTARKQVEGDRAAEWLYWCLGANLFGTVLTYFGINTGIVPLYLVLAFVSVGALEARATVEAKVEVAAEPHLVAASNHAAA